jgi:hypothetical protein
MRATTAPAGALLLCLALLLPLALLPSARAQTQPRLVGYVPNSYARRCPSDVRVKVFAQAQTTSGGFGPSGRSAYVSGTVQIASQSAVRVQGSTVTLFPTTNVSPIRAEATCANSYYAATNAACDFAVAIPRNQGPSSYARNWQGAMATVFLASGAVCESPVAYIQGTSTWGDIGADVGSSVGSAVGGAIAGDLGSWVGGAIGQAIGRDVISGPRPPGGGPGGGRPPPLFGRKLLLAAAARA